MSLAQDFGVFWKEYPRKVGKLAALKAYEKARKSLGATQEEILSGVAAYVEHKPAYADFCHPATWLNQGRWMDEHEARTVRRSSLDWWDECKQIHGGTCAKRWDHESKKIDARHQA